MINVQELEGRVLPVRFRPQSAFLLPADEAVKAEHLCEINVVYADVKKGEFIGVGYESMPDQTNTIESEIRGRLREDGLVSMTKIYNDNSPLNGLMVKYRGSLLNQRDHVVGQGIYFLNEFNKMDQLVGQLDITNKQKSQVRDMTFGTWRLY
jgi:hypothetical protein